MRTPECEPVREAAAELALGIADGEQRARALEHLAECAECRAHLERLSTVADELSLMAPSAEPPPGFESRTVESMQPPTPRRERRWRVLATALAGLAAACLAAGLVWVALEDDREVADAYRDVLAVADGEYFDASTLVVPGGAHAGYVYGYQGRASWAFAVVYDEVAPGSYGLEVVDREGREYPATEVEIAADGDGSSGAVIPIDWSEVTMVRLLDDQGREVADSRIEH